MPVVTQTVLSAPTPLDPVVDADFADIPDYASAYVAPSSTASSPTGFVNSGDFDDTVDTLVLISAQVEALTLQVQALNAAIRDIKKLTAEA